MFVHWSAANLRSHATLARTLTVMLLSMAGGAVAQTPPGPPSSVLYYKQNTACLASPYCSIPASPVFPNPDNYTKLVSLALPRGTYLVTSKLSAYAWGGTAYVNFECALLSEADAPVDFSSFDGTWQQTLFLQAPLTVTAAGGGSVHLGCRAFGFARDGQTLVDMRVWNASLAAVRVGSIQSQ